MIKYRSGRGYLNQISLEDLKKEDGLHTLIPFLDSHLKKDDLADSLEKFEDFQRQFEITDNHRQSENTLHLLILGIGR